MPYVQCEIRPGLRDTEVGVTVYDIDGRPERLRTDSDFVRNEGGSHYLPIGIIGRHPTEEKVLIELPLEADSGVNRIWVCNDQLLPNGEVAETEPLEADPLLGLMSDEPELVDAVLASTYESRESDPLRLPRDG